MKLNDRTNDPLPMLAPRSPDSHKGDFGRALLLGGSRGMAGAIALAGRSTLRSGAGLVTLAVPDCILDVVAIFEPSYMTRPLPDDHGQFALHAADELLEMVKAFTVIAIGPGLGRGQTLTKLVAKLYATIEQPMVVDADALFALSESPGILDQPGGPRVLTPHPGEFARLAGEMPPDDQRTVAAAQLAARDRSSNTTVLLKGHRTVVTDGTQYAINNTGNPGMATGGAGDVLTGIITGLLCQGLRPFDAARLGAHLHGQASDLAAKKLGKISLIASDIVEYLPKAFQETVASPQ